MIYLYNSLTRKKEEFRPLTEGSVLMYTCGPTVYDYQHVGNMRAYITWDILKRFLTSQGYAVTHIMNITDVGHLTSDSDDGEDKMEVARARERLTAWDIAEKYTEYFKNDLQALNIIPPTRFVKATELIEDQIAFVKKLDEKGFLYRTTDGMYFDTSKDPEYGKLGRTSLLGLMKGARVTFNAEKKNPTDFAVWKFSPRDAKRDMEWDSPWGKGFPGWHLECSVISMKYLGETFDIHTGGIDHLTIHHPNEMAQSKAVTGKLQARYWLHNNFMTQKDKKMSKSAGTFVRLEDIMSGDVSALSYRYFVMQTHYRKEIAYSWEAIKAAKQGLQNIYKDLSFYDDATDTDEGCDFYEKKFYEAIGDDMNISRGLSVMQQMMKSSEPTKQKFASLLRMDTVLGLRFREEWDRRRNLTEMAREYVREREEARKNKDWATSDMLRSKLLEHGVEVLDTKDGQVAVMKE